MEEIWKDIPGYEGLYKISSLGRLFGIKRNNIRKPSKSGGYLVAYLSKNGKWDMWGIHVLMCMAFYGPKPFPNAVARHLDDVGTNNVLDNLAWGSKANNVEDFMIRRRNAQNKSYSPIKDST